MIDILAQFSYDDVVFITLVVTFFRDLVSCFLPGAPRDASITLLLFRFSECFNLSRVSIF